VGSVWSYYYDYASWDDLPQQVLPGGILVDLPPRDTTNLVPSLPGGAGAAPLVLEEDLFSTLEQELAQGEAVAPEEPVAAPQAPTMVGSELDQRMALESQLGQQAQDGAAFTFTPTMATTSLTPEELRNQPHNVAVPLAVSRQDFKEAFTFRTFRLIEEKAVQNTDASTSEILEILSQYFYFTPESRKTHQDE
jgi:hypothetical protein